MKQNKFASIVLAACVFLGIASGTLFYSSGANVTKMVGQVSDVSAANQSFSTSPISFETTLSDEGDPLVRGALVLTVSGSDKKAMIEQSKFVVQAVVVGFLSDKSKDAVVSADFEAQHRDGLIQELGTELGFPVDDLTFTELQVVKDKPLVELDKEIDQDINKK